MRLPFGGPSPPGYFNARLSIRAKHGAPAPPAPMSGRMSRVWRGRAGWPFASLVYTDGPDQPPPILIRCTSSLFPTLHTVHGFPDRCDNQAAVSPSSLSPAPHAALSMVCAVDHGVPPTFCSVHALPFRTSPSARHTAHPFLINDTAHIGCCHCCKQHLHCRSNQRCVLGGVPLRRRGPSCGP